MPFLPDHISLAAVCACDKTLTLSAAIFQSVVVAGFALCYYLFSDKVTSFWKRFGIVCAGIGIFEIFTAPLWTNEHMGQWGYIYQDVSWVLTVGWATLILSVVSITDIAWKKTPALMRFFMYLGFLTPITVLAESLVVGIGIRSYSPEVMQAVSGIPIVGIPIEVLYYVPVFMALVISFYKYWALVVEHMPAVPMKRKHTLRNLAISIIGVFLFELMIEPMVRNYGFPGWSYVYRDISIVLTGLWVVIIWIIMSVIDVLFIQVSLKMKFALYVGLCAILTYPVEMLFIRSGMRVYGSSAVSNFSGFVTPLTGIPVEVAFAIPLYLALIIAFIRYMQIMFENKYI